MNKQIAQQLNLKDWQVKNTLQLFSEGATIPFISRYRKEATGELDEVEIGNIRDLFEQLKELEKRKEFVLKTITEQGKLSDELKSKINSCTDINELEDIYLPYKPKRKTRAEKARQLGLEGLAKIIMKQDEKDPQGRANQFVKGDVKNKEEAIKGALDIIAEWISENDWARKQVRYQFENYASITSKLVKGKEEEGQKYKDHFKAEEKLNRCPSHRLLAKLRGEEEGILRVSIAPEKEYVLEKLEGRFAKGYNASSALVREATQDAYKRLIAPSMETETRKAAKLKADEEAIRVFAKNLKQLLLESPLGGKRIMAIDPGFKSGCKVVCLDANGDLKHNETIYPHPPQRKTTEALKKVSSLADAHKIEAIAIGNGTASRETENFIRRLSFKNEVRVYIVNEAGASVYSASSIAREEFPTYDVTVRGAVSIGRRLMDPLAELVKIDPKAIGVGQYQHDVDQNLLKKSLDDTVINAVNKVGINLNTASKHLLQYVSGLGPQLAQNIVDYRSELGRFDDLKQLNKVARMGAKAFEQSAGFLRIKEGKNELDNTGVHPEAYKVVKQMAKKAGVGLNDLIRNESVINTLNLNDFVSEEFGLPTLQDIKEELLKPGHDPRKLTRVFEFDKNIKTVEDLRVGMELPGVVSNITNFGAFVNVGVKQDGLVHISQIANEFISNPADYLDLNQCVNVKVMEVDLQRNRIQFSMKELEQPNKLG